MAGTSGRKTAFRAFSPPMTTWATIDFICLPLSREVASFQGRSWLILDGHLRTEPLQLLCQRLVVGTGRLVLRIEFDGCAEIGQRAGPVTLPAPEFAAGVENIR